MEADASDWDTKQTYHFLTSAVAPRPIAWVTTLDAATGVVNAAPFSWFQSVCADPPTLMLALADRSDGSPKDTLRNIEASGEFVVNVATRDLATAIVASSGSFPSDVSEVEAVGLATTPSARVGPPRLADSPVHMECRLVATHRLGDGNKDATTLVLGEVVHFAADDDALDERGNVDSSRVPFLARLCAKEYIAVADVFEVARPPRPDPDRDA